MSDSDKHRFFLMEQLEAIGFVIYCLNVWIIFFFQKLRWGLANEEALAHPDLHLDLKRLKKKNDI